MMIDSPTVGFDINVDDVEWKDEKEVFRMDTGKYLARGI